MDVIPGDNTVGSGAHYCWLGLVRASEPSVVLGRAWLAESSLVNYSLIMNNC